MESKLLLGDEAVALGALHAGISGAFAYPGTPATEIFEAIQEWAPEVWAQWSANEKVAYEEALGMSYAGKRALISMKHVGLNVAADPFINSALTGVNGGMVLVVADDPGMHSSQNEQDSRFYAEFAKVPCFEPGNQQQCYDMTREAFEMSESLRIPVMLRLVTRLSHSRSNVKDSAPAEPNPLPLPDPNDWTLVPANARRRYRRLLDLQPRLRQLSEENPANHLELLGRRGVICSGIAYNYVREALGDDRMVSILRIGMYPLPNGLIRSLVDHCDEIFVFEDGYPFIETRLNGIFGVPGRAIHGKLDGTLPPDGELSPDLAAHVLTHGAPTASAPETLAVPRPPQLCKGCPHSDSFGALVDATSGFEHAALFSDIGCYSLGVMAPYKAVHSCVDMGASISMAHGASRAGAHPVICTIGDSTFTHSGMTPLIGAIRSDADMTVIILDNATTAMTGAQDSFATGEELVSLLKGLGVRDLHLFEPLRKNHEENVATLKAAIEHRGLSVVVARRACIHIKAKKPVSAMTPVCQAAVGGVQ